MSSKKHNTDTIRCAIYTRKSSEEGLDSEFNSLDAQRESAESFIVSQKSAGWVCLPEQYNDGGFSGGNVERPGLKRLIADIEAGKIDCVVVYKVDRLSRSLMDFARMMETFEQYDISFVSVTQQFNTTHSMGRLTLNILLSFAQFEREIIGERIRDKIAAQRRKGKWAGGTPVLGYDVDRSGGSPKLIVNQCEAIQVRQIYELYLELGSLLPVVDELKALGLPNKTWHTRRGKPKGGKPFDKCSLHALLTNPIYIGKVKHKSDVFDGEHEPIVDADLFDDVQTQLKANGRTPNGQIRNKHNAFIRGLLFCKHCNSAMVHTFTNKRNRRYRYYRCAQLIKKGRSSCPTPSLPATEIERAVIDEIRMIAQDQDLQREVFNRVKSLLEEDREGITRSITNLTRQLSKDHNELQRLSDSPDPSNAIANCIAGLHERIHQNETELNRLRGKVAEQTERSIEKDEVIAALNDFDQLWDTLRPREQQRVLALLVSRIEFNAADNSIKIDFINSKPVTNVPDQSLAPC
ncbi:recombinase family protein [Bremerella sp. T1]|uniref:recombinase family protein n=1 Tax=Bremerella sp. TYQ1 TaxID=3119568 RepID=UPI001CCD8A71|nr:recombinase family protein [Bremerella volcania]UBM36965.1 recombinase family protein [Bremerella volcania]